jgi:hypothetical protein
MKRNLLLAFAALQVLDVLSTQYFLSTGRSIEGNPFVLLLMVHLGAWWWVAKLALAMTSVPVLVRAKTRYAVGLVGLTAVVVVNNLTI